MNFCAYLFGAIEQQPVETRAIEVPVGPARRENRLPFDRFARVPGAGERMSAREVLCLEAVPHAQSAEQFACRRGQDFARLEAGMPSGFEDRNLQLGKAAPQGQRRCAACRASTDDGNISRS